MQATTQRARRAVVHPPRLVPTSIGLLAVSIAAALRWHRPAAVAVWAVGAACSVLLAGGPRAAGADLRYVAGGLRRRDPRRLWSLPAGASQVSRRLPDAVRAWLGLAAQAALTLLALAVVSR